MKKELGNTETTEKNRLIKIINKMNEDINTLEDNYKNTTAEYLKTLKKHTNIINEIRIKNYFKRIIKNKKALTIDNVVVNYNDNKYIVCKIMRKKIERLFVIDYDMRDSIIYYTWFITNMNYIGKVLYIGNEKLCLLLHNYVMGKYTFDGQGSEEMYDHINRITTDNRKANLRLSNYAENSLNKSRRKRTVILPKDCKIDTSDIPKCVWYIQAKVRNGVQHGDGFVVEIKKDKESVRWTSATSIELSLRFKLEQTKKYLRLLKVQKPEIFEEHHIECDYNEEAIKLAKEYNEIIKLSEYKCATNNLIVINEKNYLKEDLTDLTEKEIEILNGFTLTKNKTKRNMVSGSKIPADSGITIDMIPKYCYYTPPNKTRGTGEQFIIDKHPKLTTRDWKTTSKKGVSLKEKFDSLLNKLKELDNA